MKAIVAALALSAVVSHAQAATRLPATSDALAEAMRGSRVVLLGEVHDNAAQHALRAQALRAILQSGGRPAIAFEQFDASAQAPIDQARRDRPRDVDYLVAQARGAAGWNWAMYKPFIALALEYDLPIVAANLARADAMQLATSAAPSDAPAELVRAQEEVAKTGHCNLLPPEAVPGIARAQIARDRALAQSIAPHAERGVVLLTGNGHARKDIGVPRWLAVPNISIALVEDEEDAGAYDYYIVTERAARPDPCEELRRRTKR
jgi:uncharacterized iron-regulated protein